MGGRTVYKIVAAKLHGVTGVELTVRSLAVLAAVCASALADQAPRLYSDVPDVRQGKAVLWHDPGTVETKELEYCS